MSGSFIVTGGAGFIGSNLVRALNERGETDILVVDHLNHPDKRRNLERLRFRDFSDKEEFRKALRENRLPAAGGVFHLGACSSTTEMNEAYINDNNYQYTRELCEWSLRAGARFVYASSAATYGDGSLGYSDSDQATPTLKPLNPYGRSKQMFDLWALATGALRRIAGLKYFNVYGPWEDLKGDMRSLVHKAYGQMMREGRITLFRSYRPEYRDGEQERDFVHVSDAVAARSSSTTTRRPAACSTAAREGRGRGSTWPTRCSRRRRCRRGSSSSRCPRRSATSTSTTPAPTW